MEISEKVHPTLGILVRNNGEVLVPANGTRLAHWTRGSKNSKGYLRVGIGGKRYFVHSLVLEAFVGPCPEGFECNHKDRNRSDNRLENLEWVTHQDNCRNTSSHDRVEAQGRTHYYEDARKAHCEHVAHYRAEHPEKVREYDARYRQSRLKTHRRVRFADGSMHWINNSEAEAYLIIPLNQRIFKE